MSYLLDYVGELFEAMKSISRKDRQSIEKELDEQVPQPMHSMLEKQDKQEALTKYKERKEKEIVICPPTCSSNVILT